MAQSINKCLFVNYCDTPLKRLSFTIIIYMRKNIHIVLCFLFAAKMAERDGRMPVCFSVSKINFEWLPFPQVVNIPMESGFNWK